MLSKDQINHGFNGHINCAMHIVQEWSEKLGYDKKDSMRMASPFGGGFWRGDNCGAVCGSMMVIGMKYGHCDHGDEDGNNTMIAKTHEFTKAFIEKNGTLTCRELVQYDFSVDGELEKAFESGRIADFCPGMVQSALEILESIM